MKRLIFTLTVVFIMLSLTIAVKASTGNERKWWFLDEEFSELPRNYLENDVTINGLTLSKGLEVVYSNKKIKNIFFDKSIYTIEDGSKNRGYIKFYVNGDTDIHILGGSKSRTEDREITILSEANYKFGRVLLSEIDDYKYKYRGPAGNIYLYTTGGGVRIFGITAKDYIESEYTPLGENEKIQWKFTDYYHSNSTLSNGFEINNLKVYANAENTVETGNSMVYSPYGDVKHGYVNLKGRGKYDSRYMSFPVPPNSDIYISARSSDKISERTLLVRNTYYGIPDTNLDRKLFDSEDTKISYLDVNGDLNTYKISYYGEGEDFVLYYLDSGIRIYNISIVPRVSKTIESKTWDISKNSNFAVEGNVNKVIDGLGVYKANIAQCSIDGYSKRLKIKGDVYQGAGMVKFNISDSSGTRGEKVKRVISVKANTTLEGAMLVLVNSEKYVIGSENLSTDIKEYKFEYTGVYDEISVYTYYPENKRTAYTYIYSIDNGIADIKGPNDTSRTINVESGKDYQLYFTAENVNADNHTYKITYNDNALSIKYIGYGDSPNKYSKEGLNIIEASFGEIVYTIDKDYDKWSGVTVSVIFKANSSGNTTINYIADINS